jgi:hypothetical protein
MKSGTEATPTTTNAVSTTTWLNEFVQDREHPTTDHFLEWMHNFIERIQQSSYSDGYIDGGKPHD